MPKLCLRRSSRLHAPARQSTGDIPRLIILVPFQMQTEKYPEDAEVIFETAVDLKRKQFSITRARVWKRGKIRGAEIGMQAEWIFNF